MGRRPGSAEDVMSNPKDFGMPTFEEFAQNREKWLGRDDEILEGVAKGGDTTKGMYRRHQYEIEGYKCSSLDEVERVALSQGIALRDLDYRATLVDTGSGKNDVLIRFISKTERDKRASWR